MRSLISSCRSSPILSHSSSPSPSSGSRWAFGEAGRDGSARGGAPPPSPRFPFLCPPLADPHARPARVPRPRHFPGLAVDVHVRKGGVREPGLQVFPDQLVFLQ